MRRKSQEHYYNVNEVWAVSKGGCGVRTGFESGLDKMGKPAVDTSTKRGQTAAANYEARIRDLTGMK